jgi:hypothetical protein
MHSKRIIEREFRAQTMDGNAETQQTYAEVTMIPSGTRTGRCKSSVIHRMIDRAPLPFLRLWVCHSGIIWQISSPPAHVGEKSKWQPRPHRDRSRKWRPDSPDDDFKHSSLKRQGKNKSGVHVNCHFFPVVYALWLPSHA